MNYIKHWDSLVTEEDKFIYYSNIVDGGGLLCYACYEWCSEELRINYLKCHNNLDLSDKHFEISSDFIKGMYIDNILDDYINRYRDFSVHKYNMCSDKLKIKFLEKLIELGQLGGKYFADYRELKIKEILND